MFFALNILSLIQLLDGPWDFPRDIFRFIFVLVTVFDKNI